MRIAIFGVTGRMGQTLLKALREVSTEGMGGDANAPCTLAGALASTQSRRLGQDAETGALASGVQITADPLIALERAEVAIDFSLPQAIADNVSACAAAGVPLVLGTTGGDAAARNALRSAATVIPVLIAPNTSIGLNVVSELVKRASHALGPQYDVEISEIHHRLKRDAPSGTALALGGIVAASRGVALEQVAVFDRHGSCEPRSEGAIGFSVQRAADVVGEHTVTFAVAGERIEITHRATDRMIFARGALKAARWLVGRTPGLYSMQDVLEAARS